jgi:UDPglucose--hexose-1-phosphate uridylyltransferase
MLMPAPSPTAASLIALADTPHRRRNALTGEWVLVSPHRAKRPWLGQIERVAPPTRPEYDPTCYLCPGNERAGGIRNPRYTSTFVFDNDFPALKDVATRTRVEPNDLLIAESESGICRVACFSPRHDLSLPGLQPHEIRAVIDVWAQQYEQLGARPDINHVQIFENKGEMMGASNPHPHCQIWAQHSIPVETAREGEQMRAHLARTGRTLLTDYLHIELESGERVICSNDGFVAVVPFWAVWPFEALVISRRPATSLSELSDTERNQLADIIKRLTTRYDNLFETSFPYSAGTHQAPTDGKPHPECHLHMHFYPPLLRSSTIRKFLVGYEMLAEPQRDLTAETAAERLRGMSEQHFTGVTQTSTE